MEVVGIRRDKLLAPLTCRDGVLAICDVDAVVEEVVAHLTPRHKRVVHEGRVEEVKVARDVQAALVRVLVGERGQIARDLCPGVVVVHCMME